MDFVNDPSPQVLLKAAAFLAWPAEFDNAAVLDKSEIDQLHRSCFADVDRREYPLHKASAVFFSNLHYRGRGGSDSKIIERLDKAVEAFGLGEKLAAYSKHFDEVTQTVKSASVDAPASLERFALELGDVRRYPITTRWDIQDSALRASADCREGVIDRPLFAKVAAQLVDAAGRFGLPADELPRDIRDLGTLREFSPEKASALLQGLDAEEMLPLHADLLKVAADLHDPAQRYAVAEAWAEVAREKGAAQTPEFVVRKLWGGPVTAELEKLSGEVLLFDTDDSPLLVPRTAVAAAPASNIEQWMVAGEHETVAQVIKQAAENVAQANALLQEQTQDFRNRLLRAISGG